MKHLAIAVAGILCAGTLAGIGGCSYVVAGYERAFDATTDGDSLAQVMSRFGEPGVTERRGVLFERYAARPCSGECSVRLWWEHPILRGLEAWSIELDGTGRVIHKAHWVLP